MKLNKAKIKKYFDSKRYSVLIIPDSTDKKTKTKNFSNWEIITWIFCYTMVIAALGAIVVNITPLKNLLPFQQTVYNKLELKTINELNKRIIQLSSDLNKLQRNNERLKNALELGDSTIFTRGNTSKKRTGGSILEVFKDLIQKIQNSQEKEIIFFRPVSGFLSRNFAPDKGHMGVDFVVKTGTPVYATANGFVIFADYTVKDGYMMIISHPGNYISVYKHCSSLLKKVRENVVQGELIALSGNTGEITTGPHLHFEIWNSGKPVNPITILFN
jgi:murein DD-endopeptidase MepM/ murein hydrolase activator NlpD